MFFVRFLFFGFVGCNYNNLVPFLDTLFCDLTVFDFSKVVFDYSKGLVSCLKAVRLFMRGAGITLCVCAFNIGKNCRVVFSNPKR